MEQNHYLTICFCVCCLLGVGIKVYFHWWMGNPVKIHINSQVNSSSGICILSSVSSRERTIRSNNHVRCFVSICVVTIMAQPNLCTPCLYICLMWLAYSSHPPPSHRFNLIFKGKQKLFFNLVHARALGTHLTAIVCCVWLDQNEKYCREW